MTIPAIRVTRALYDGFSISFPDGTGCWSHTTQNVAARITEYRATAKRPVDVDWRVGDVACPVQVDGKADRLADECHGYDLDGNPVGETR